MSELKATLEEPEEGASNPRAEMAAVVVHQLRNRVSRVLFGADALLAASTDHPALTATAGRLRRGIDELTAAFDQLIELARLLAPDATLRLEPVDVSALAAAAVERVQPLLHARGHSIVLDRPGGPVWLEADRVALDLLLSNLLSNAAKFTPLHGHIAVRIELQAAQVRVAVRDDGMGIAPQRVGVLLTEPPFATRPPGEPRGLQAGLLVVQRVAELHGGQVRVTSEGLGKGSEFSVTLPLDAARRAPRDESTPRALVVAGAPNAVAASLRAWGYQVEVVDLEQAPVRAQRAAMVIVPVGVARREPTLAARLRAANRGAMLILLGDEGMTVVEPGFDRVLNARLDADLLQASIVAG